VAEGKVRFHAPSTLGAAPVATPFGAFRTIIVAFGALHRWWAAAGRHYRPERRYMRGGRTHP
jgi:hypothetical protein